MVEDPSDTPRPLAEISHGPSAFEAFLDRNQKNLIVLGIVLAAAAAGWIVYSGIKEGAEKSAGAALSKAESLQDLQDLLKSQPDSVAAGSARLLVAEKQWEAGDQDAAIETLRECVAGSAGHPSGPTARASLASRLMQQGKNEEAAGLFRDLADAPDAKFIAPYALISLGDLAKADGKLDEAEQFYKRVQDGFAESPMATLADQHLRMLRFKAPLEIEAPPAPAPTPDEAGKAEAPKDPAPQSAAPQEVAPAAPAPAPAPAVEAPAAPADGKTN